MFDDTPESAIALYSRSFATATEPARQRAVPAPDPKPQSQPNKIIITPYNSMHYKHFPFKSARFSAIRPLSSDREAPLWPLTNR
jgi:hypothetical protein